MKGFEAPIHSSLCHPIMLGGAPREYAILNGMISASLVLGLQSFWGIPIFFFVQGVGVLLAKHDPYFVQVFHRHLLLPHYFDV